jgi:hypothetical protein
VDTFSFSYLTGARTSYTVFNKSGNDLLFQIVQFFPVMRNVNCGLMLYGIYYVVIPYITNLMRVFRMQECYILSDVFSIYSEMIIWFISFLKWYIKIIGLYTLKHFTSQGGKLNLIMMNVHFNVLLNSEYLLVDCSFLFIKNIAL